MEHLLSDVLFIDSGRLVLDSSVEAIGERYQQLDVAAGKLEAARALHPFYERQVFGRAVMLFEDQSRERLAGLGELRTPGIADLFVAKIQRAAA